MTARQEILTRLVAARVAASGFHADQRDFVRELRVLTREILDQDESPVEVTKPPTATQDQPYEGFGFVGQKWVPIWFDGTTWRRNNATGADVTSTVTHFRTLSPP